MKVYSEWEERVIHKEENEIDDEVMLKIGKKPKYKVGDHAVICYGDNEGWDVTIKDIRYRDASRGYQPYTKSGYEYLVSTGLRTEWLSEGQLW